MHGWETLLAVAIGAVVAGAACAIRPTGRLSDVGPICATGVAAALLGAFLAAGLGLPGNTAGRWIALAIPFDLALIAVAAATLARHGARRTTR